MACGCFILSHDNVFNKTVLGENAYYYTDEKDLASILDGMGETIEKKDAFIAGNIQVVRDRYSWEKLTNHYEKFFLHILTQDANR